MHPILATLITTTAFMAAPEAAVPVILDTDIGDDIDDTWALAMLLGSPQVDLKLITTAFNDTPTKTRLVAKILQQVGRTDVPIGTGVRTEVKPIHQTQWLGDYDLKDYPGKIHEDGVQALIDAIKAAPGTINVVVIGPQTNIAAALERDPSIAEKARILSMAGSVRIGYDGAAKPMPEWNVLCDPKAVQRVFSAPWEIVLDPLDICGTLRLTGDDYRRVEQSDAPLAKVVIENYDQWALRSHHPKDASSILFDTVAAYLSFDESCVTLEDLKLSVTDKGETVLNDNGRPVKVATAWKDEAAFKNLLIEALTRK